MKEPIKDYVQEEYPEGNVSQWFGENPKLYAFLGLKGHNGIDIVAPYGTPILATSTQTIVEVKDNPSGYGKHIRAIDDTYEYTYGHLSEISVEVGDEAKVGYEIGKMGNSGFVVSGATPFWEYNPYAGTHLHFGVREIGGTDNWSIYGDYKVYIDNYPGFYKGAIDPEPLFALGDVDKKKHLMLTIISLSNQVISLLKKIIKKKQNV